MKFNVKKVSTRETVNKAGGVAFSMNPENELIHAVLTTFLDEKYYESSEERMERVRALIGMCDAQFVSNLAIVARKEFNLRSISHLLVGELAKLGPKESFSLVKDTIVEVAQRPDDLLEIAAVVGMPMPKQVKRGIRNAILKFDRYSLAKYQGKGREISMVDLFNLTHPKVQHASEEQQKAWKDLMTGSLVSFDTWETELSNAKDDNARKEALENLISENKIGYMALLRNLNNLIKYGVNKETRKLVVEKLTNVLEVAKSKQLPFRFVTAFENVTGDREFSDAISEAMDIAVSNTPKLDGKILIAIDTSGSMDGDPLQKASIFGATLLKANVNAEVILYATSVKVLPLSGRTPVIDLAKNIEKSGLGGGTQTSLVFDYATTMKQDKPLSEGYSRIIIISDNQSWNEDSVQQAYQDYKRVTGNDPYIYAVDIQGYGTTDIRGGKVIHLTSWSDRLLDFIGQSEKGETLLDYVQNYHLQEK